MKHSCTPILTLTALLGLGLLTTSALAQDSAQARPRYDQKSILVDFDDLDPALPADASTLLARVEHGVRTACMRSEDIRNLVLADEHAACMLSSYTASITRINRALGIDLEALAARRGLIRSDSSIARSFPGNRN